MLRCGFSILALRAFSLTESLPCWVSRFLQRSIRSGFRVCCLAYTSDAGSFTLLTTVYVMQGWAVLELSTQPKPTWDKSAPNGVQPKWAQTCEKILSQVGLEPTTSRLRGWCSTNWAMAATEYYGNNFGMSPICGCAVDSQLKCCIVG